MASFLLTAAYVMALLATGSLNTISMKIAFSISGVGVDGEAEVFQKPWFITFVMFVAMTAALLFDRSLWPCGKASKTAAQVPLIAVHGAHGDSYHSHQMSWRKKVLFVAIPSVFDIIATGLCCMGFLYIPPSVWQLLRGAEMVFAAIFAVGCLGRRLFAFHWLGLLFCVAGIVLVGLASVWGEDSARAAKGTDSEGAWIVLFGMGLALLGQVVQAAQVVAEEWLLKDVDLPGLQIVGFEGLWGGLIMLSVVFPLLYALPGSDHGHFEDEADAVAVLSSNWKLLGIIAIYTFSCGTYNVAGLAVTGALSAVHRVMLEALRTSIVWGFGLTVHYAVDKHSPLGEVWTPYSILEVVGFFILVLGQAVYGAMVKVPGLWYPPTQALEELLPSPGGMRSMASPLPPQYEMGPEDLKD